MRKFLLTLPFFVLAAPANAQSVCGEREGMIGFLAAEFGEHRRAGGLVPGNRMMELFVSEENGTWTLMISAPNGVACLVATGDYYVEYEIEHEPPPVGERG